MAQVLILAADADLAQRVTATIAAAGCTPVTCEGRARFERHAATALSAVIVARELGTNGWIPWLAGVCGEYPELPAVVVTANDADNLRLLAHVRVHAILYPSEIDRLPELLGRQPFEAFFAAVDASIRDANHLPLALRRAMRYAANQTRAAEAVPGMAAEAPARSVKDLAARLGYAPGYLSHLAAEAGIHLGSFIAWCIALRGIEMVLIHALSVEQTAWWLGFEHPSGLSDLCLRVISNRPSRIQARHLPALFDAFQKAFPQLNPFPAAQNWRDAFGSPRRTRRDHEIRTDIAKSD